MTEQTRSPYAIDNLLPAGERRFLKIRDEFMRITGNRVVDSCVLEIVLFETARLLSKLDPDEKDREFTLHHRGTQPLSESVLWVEIPTARVLERLCGWTDSKRTVQRAFTELEEHGLIVTDDQRRVGAKRRVILHVSVLQEAINGAGYTEADWGGPGAIEAIKGTVSLISFPDAEYHALYPTLIDAVAIASQESGNTLTRMTLVLLELLFVSDQLASNARSPASKWSARDLTTAMRFGRTAVWMSALKLLGSSGLLTRVPGRETDGARVYEPNLAAIETAIAMAIRSRNADSDFQGTKGHTSRDKRTHFKGQKDTIRETDEHASGDKGLSSAVIPELSPEPSGSMRERGGAQTIEPPALKVPRSSLPRISSDESGFTVGSLVRSTMIPSDLLALDLPRLGLRPDVIEACSQIDGDPIVLANGYRTGKTVLAAAIMWALMEKAERRESKPGRWINLEEITPDLRRLPFNSDGYTSALEKLMSASTKGPIVLDGVDEAENKNLLGLMKDALQKYVNMGNQVIITTHLPVDQLGLAFGPKMGARLEEEAIVIDCSNPAWVSDVTPSLRVVSE